MGRLKRWLNKEPVHVTLFYQKCLKWTEKFRKLIALKLQRAILGGSNEKFKMANNTVQLNPLTILFILTISTFAQSFLFVIDL